MPAWERMVAIVGGLLLIYPGLVTDVAGIALIGVIGLTQVLSVKKSTLKTA